MRTHRRKNVFAIKRYDIPLSDLSDKVLEVQCLQTTTFLPWRLAKTANKQ
jgi:hypothetical protein